MSSHKVDTKSSDANFASKESLWIKMLSAGTAACFADMVTFPLDTAKVRLQIQGQGKNLFDHTLMEWNTTNVPKYRGLLNTLRIIVKEEGFLSVYNGLVPGLQRQMCFSTIRLGLYDEVKLKYAKLLYGENLPSDMMINVRILSGLTTGGVSVILAQPTDVVKIKMQAQKTTGPSITILYKNTLQAYAKIGRQEGMKGLWKGCVPNMIRNAIVNVGEVVAYDIIKTLIIRHDIMSDSVPCHVVSGAGAGFCATVVASPVDVVKTRYMNSPLGEYRGVIHCAYSVWKEGKLKAFYKGFVPSFMRLGSWNIVMFMCYEQLKAAIHYTTT
ncbi:hypothetical protein FSP39_004188 [Pinctada imbricata]|uniref:Solute carrier family 25 member 7 n=1 Tax=Pinctada imbricata TaxID=66713 RepID=A0AA89BVN5_PINIB|nr:hypothetical protein FSP39_004188 [Pinctada imbricata]